MRNSESKMAVHTHTHTHTHTTLNNDVVVFRAPNKKKNKQSNA